MSIFNHNKPRTARHDLCHEFPHQRPRQAATAYRSCGNDVVFYQGAQKRQFGSLFSIFLDGGNHIIHAQITSI